MTYKFLCIVLLCSLIQAQIVEAQDSILNLKKKWFFTADVGYGFAAPLSNMDYNTSVVYDENSNATISFEKKDVKAGYGSGIFVNEGIGVFFNRHSGIQLEGGFFKSNEISNVNKNLTILSSIQGIDKEVFERTSTYTRNLNSLFLVLNYLYKIHIKKYNITTSIGGILGNNNFIFSTTFSKYSYKMNEPQSTYNSPLVSSEIYYRNDYNKIVLGVVGSVALGYNISPLLMINTKISYRYNNSKLYSDISRRDVWYNYNSLSIFLGLQYKLTRN